MKIAFQGEHGAYSEQAIFEYFGDAQTLPCESFDVVFDAVNGRKCDAGLIPIENSIAGSIHENYDLLFRHDSHITGETVLRVRHCLIALPDVKKDEIRKAISHPQALAQCAGYLRLHGIKVEQVYDTAGSVKMLKESGARDTAAIASKRAAELYGMQILEEGIEDSVENYTRFLIIGREATVPAALSVSKGKGEAKTSILFTLKDQADMLSKTLSIFALQDINITKIESRPLQGEPWQYIFYIDFIGAMHEEKINPALEQLNEYALTLRVLGSYPRFKG